MLPYKTKKIKGNLNQLAVIMQTEVISTVAIQKYVTS